MKVLTQAGVTRIYGLVGDSLNALSDAVRRSGGATKGGVDWVQVYNEEGAAFAASADAQLTGRLAVCAGSCGPGNTHLIQGVALSLGKLVLDGGMLAARKGVDRVWPRCLSHGTSCPFTLH